MFYKEENALSTCWGLKDTYFYEKPLNANMFGSEETPQSNTQNLRNRSIRTVHLWFDQIWLIVGHHL